MSKHTIGPWEYEKLDLKLEYEDDLIIINVFSSEEFHRRSGHLSKNEKITPKWTDICSVYGRKGWRSEKTMIANASLIAAAPKMYKVIKHCADVLNSLCEKHHPNIPKNEIEDVLIEIQNLLKEIK